MARKVAGCSRRREPPSVGGTLHLVRLLVRIPPHGERGKRGRSDAGSFSGSGASWAQAAEEYGPGRLAFSCNGCGVPQASQEASARGLAALGCAQAAGGSTEGE